MDILFVRQGEYKKGDAAFPLIAEAVNDFLLLSGRQEADASDSVEADAPDSGGADKKSRDSDTAGAQGFDAVTITEDVIRRTPEGRPCCCISGAPDISVTHSGDIWMCLVSDRRCGVDFQYCRSQDSVKIVNRYYTEGEREYIEGGQTEQFTGSFLRTEEGRSGRFFDIWVRREALGKYEGHGFFGNYPDSAPGGIPAESVYILQENTEKSTQVFIHEITASMLAKAGIHTTNEFRAVCVSETAGQPVIKTI